MSVGRWSYLKKLLTGRCTWWSPPVLKITDRGRVRRGERRCYARLSDVRSHEVTTGEMLLVEVTTPTMLRTPEPTLYDVPCSSSVRDTPSREMMPRESSCRQATSASRRA